MKTILSMPTGRQAGITATRIWFLKKPKTKSASVYQEVFTKTFASGLVESFQVQSHIFP